MFTGKEVEHTPAHGMQTLFVVGLQPFDDIIKTAKKHNCEHIYFGANMSYIKQSQGWTPLINRVLDETDYWVTLDYKVSDAKFVQVQGFDRSTKYIDMISVTVPNIDSLSANACIKLDDTGFDETNRGVWVHNVKKLQDNLVFTPWSKYSEDEPIGDN
jgi:hypothetical protein